jgi:SMODS-associated and fused to various effectors sensor domain
MTTTAPSASGARLTGDDLQHAVAWHAALRTLVPHAGVRCVTVETAGAGNVDDVVVYKTSGPDEYIQVKATVAAKQPASIGWLTQLSRSGGPSILQRFYHTWNDLSRNGASPALMLITNRSIDPRDPILTLRDRNDRVTEHLRRANHATIVAARERLQQHLGIMSDELYDFLSHLQFRTDASEAGWRDRVAEISYAAGIRADEAAFRLGISEIREWVKTSRAEKRAADVDAAVDRLGIRTQDPFAILAIQTLDHDHDIQLQDASVVLDWVDRFRGDEERNRRGLKNPAEWEHVLRPQLMQTQRNLRLLGARRIMVTGRMRLPAWFAVGAIHQETAGFIVAKVQDGGLWTKPSNAVAPAAITFSEQITDLRSGVTMALAVAISADPTDDIKRYFVSVDRSMPILTIGLPTGISNMSITGPDHAYAVALAVRNAARAIARTIHPPILHLFLAAPAGFALLLGSLWDRVPATQTYEDLSADGYEPAFLIPN